MRVLTTLAIAAALTLAGSALAAGFTGWSTAQKIDTVGGNSSELNTPSLDGCPQSRRACRPSRIPAMRSSATARVPFENLPLRMEKPAIHHLG